jgi:hypothetical protein
MAAPLLVSFMATAAASQFIVTGLEAEHLSLLAPHPLSAQPLPGHFSAPVLDTDTDDNILFAWRLGPKSGGIVVRNVTISAAVLTLTTPGRSAISCRPSSPPSLSVLCGAGHWSPEPAAVYTAALSVTLRDHSGKSWMASETGVFIRGRRPEEWGGAEWVGVVDPNSTTAQFRAEQDLRALGFAAAADVAQATLFVAGLGGHRASVNGRPIDPAGSRGTVTEWTNRTFYFADDITPDMRTAAANADSRVAVAIHLFKHWYGLANAWYPKPYGPRSLKAVLLLRHANGTVAYVLPTCSASSVATCAWRTGGGATLHEDLHTGQTVDARLAVPGWDTINPDDAITKWTTPSTVDGPPGRLTPHPMQRTRVLEVIRPVQVEAVRADNRTAANSYRFTLPHEVAGFCTLLLPTGAMAGTRVALRHGEAVNQGTGHLIDVTCGGMFGGAPGCAKVAFTARGNASGMDAHDMAWRHLAGGAPDQEAFTPAFQYSAFKFIQAAYSGAAVRPPSNDSLTCYRIGTAFDWTGDIVVAGAESVPHVSPTPAERFNVVAAAARSSAISNYVYDLPTDCPHREKRGWTGDSLAAHRTLAAFFDVRAAWTKWVGDILCTQSLLEPTGTVPTMVPCIFDKGVPANPDRYFCRGDPRLVHPESAPDIGDVAWGSVLPLLAKYAVDITGDARLAARSAQGAAAYVQLLHSYANDPESGLPGLLNATSISDSTGWPKSNLGDWLPAKGGGARSVSTLLNSHHLILGADAAAALQRQAAAAGRRTFSQVPAAELERWAATARRSFAQAFLQNVSVPGPEALSKPQSGLAFRDPYPPTANRNVPPALQTETAAGIAAMDRASADILRPKDRVALGAMLAELVLNTNASDPQRATVTGGIIDLAHLVPVLIAHGRPDVAFELLAADGAPSYYNMARYGGTLWENWHNADGCDTPAGCTQGPKVETTYGGVGSLNHIMFGGSVSAAVFGIGGVGPGAINRGAINRGAIIGTAVGPVTWLPDAPFGATVWRSSAGPTAAAWAAAAAGESQERWRLWVNASIPVGGGGAAIRVMLPQGATAKEVCAWECGSHSDFPAPKRPFTDEWIAFDAGGGHRELRAIVPDASAISAPVSPEVLGGCAMVWHAGPVPAHGWAGMSQVEWVAAEPGQSLFSALEIAATSGDYAVYAEECTK